MTKNNLNEHERVEALKSYNILDTFSETEFDRLTKLATIICQTPMAKVSLVDDKRQWFKSSIGLPFQETSREIAFCVHCIDTRKFFKVEDTSKDPQFQNHPLVTEAPHIRFYAGYPLTDPDGYVLGTISVMDTKPRSLTQEQILSLELVAEEVMDAILARKRREDLQVYKALFHNSLDYMSIATNEGKTLWVNKAYIDGLGWDEDTIINRGEEIAHPDDIPAAYEELEKIKKGEPLINFVLRLKTREGDYKPIQWKASLDPTTGYILATGRDITHDLRNRAEILKQKDFLNRIVEGMQEGFALANEKGEKIKVNQSLCQMTGFSKEELIGQNPPYPYWPKDRQRKNAYYFTKALQEGSKGNSFELLFQRKNGERFPVLIRTSIIHDSETDEKFVFATIQDISKSKKIEQKLLVTQKMMEQTNRVAHVGGWDIDLESQTMYWSEITRDIHEIPPGSEVTLEEGLNYYKPGYSSDTIREYWARCVEKGIPFDLELEIVTFTGKNKWVRTKSQCEIKNGKVTRVYGTFQDITSKKLTEFSIAQKEKMLKGVSMATDQLLSHRKFENAIEKSLEILGKTVEVDRVYLFENHTNSKGVLSASQIYEYNSGKCHSEITADQLQNITHDSFEPFFKPLSENKPFIAKLSTLDNSPEVRDFLALQDVKSILAIPIMYQKKFWGFIGYDECQIEKDWSDAEIVILQSFAKTIANAIERKNMDLSMEKAIAQAKAANIAKSEFLANMSHEIRTPLNGIIGFTDLVMKTSLDPTQSQYVSIVNNSANALLSIINDILDFSKIEAGKLELEVERFDVYEMASQTADIISYQAQSKYLEMLLNISLDVPRFIYTDEVRIRQVLINLLSNAIKFTEVGEVELKIEVRKHLKEDTIIRFEVRDTGIGIKQDMQHKIFEAFSQEDGSTTKKYGGTGLGLTISNQLLGLMHSKLQLRSNPGKGSTFFFDLKVKSDSGEPVEFEHMDQLHNALIVDDNDNNRTIIKQMLRLKQIDSEEANSGFEALQTIASNKNYDVILMDYHMPYMDGLETIRKIRSNFNGEAKDVPIILLYSSADDETVIKACEDLNVASRLVKPIKMQDLYNSLGKLNKLETKPLGNQETKEEKNFDENFKVLIAEDNQINMFLAKTILQRLLPNATIYEASNGQLAFDIYKRKGPDLIIMDIQMPIMNGLEATEAIRQKEKNGKRTPILALTAGNVKGQKEQCLEIGMDDFITKPVVEETLAAALQKWLPLDERTTPEILPEETEMQSERFDIKVLEGYVKNNPDLMQAFIDITLKELENSKSELADSLSHQSLEDINSAGHKLKGTASSAGLNWLFKIGLEIEQLESFDYRKIKILVQKAQDEIDEVLKLIRKKKESISQ
jgi:PAS domain S-box-containing protein